MSRKSGYRLSDKDMRNQRNLERIPVHSNGMRSSLDTRINHGRTAGLSMGMPRARHIR